MDFLIQSAAKDPLNPIQSAAKDLLIHTPLSGDSSLTLRIGFFNPERSEGSPQPNPERSEGSPDSYFAMRGFFVNTQNWFYFYVEGFFRFAWNGFVRFCLK
jgi:hypothetical protein